MIYSYRTEQAIRAATILHKDQVRKGTVPLPYVSHLFAVALIVSDYTKDEDAVIAALLHDTVEDTDYTFAELQEDFGGVVKDIVFTLSEPKEYRGQATTWEQKKSHYCKQILSGTENAAIVAAADKIHNLRSMVEDYYDNEAKFLADFGGLPQKRIDVYRNITEAINKKIPEHPITVELNNVFNEYEKFLTKIKNRQEAEQA